jgi:HIV Tat-specific factor 1
MEANSNKDKDSGESGGSNKRKAVEESWKDVPDEKNTSVYVTGLPTTITEEEFINLMKRCGIIAKKPIPGNPLNIKLYKNKDGSLKGDGCCKYVRPESVQLAIDVLDELQYDEKHVIHCEKAKFEPKGSFDPSKKPRIDPKLVQKQRKQIDKLLSWESETPLELKQKKVVLKKMFTPEQLADDPSLMLKLRDDLEQRCSRELEVVPKRIDVYDTNADGVVTITFNEPEQAQACVYAFTTNEPCLDAELWDGKTKFKTKETDEEMEKRLKRFEESIEKN